MRWTRLLIIIVIDFVISIVVVTIIVILFALIIVFIIVFTLTIIIIVVVDHKSTPSCLRVCVNMLHQAIHFSVFTSGVLLIAY